MNRLTVWIKNHQAQLSSLLVIATLHKPLFPWLDRLSHTPIAQIRWREGLIAIGLGLAITILQWVYFNDPTLVVR